MRFGDDGGGEPRVPIPNTTVKPSSADGTWTAGSWESRTSPSGCSLIAQSVEHSTVNRVVTGSSPVRGAIWPVGQAVKTPPFHGGNRGSNPLRVTTLITRIIRDANPLGVRRRLSVVSNNIAVSNEVRVSPTGHHFHQKYYGGLAQLGEHLPYKQRVSGSIPLASTI